VEQPVCVALGTVPWQVIPVRRAAPYCNVFDTPHAVIPRPFIELRGTGARVRSRSRATVAGVRSLTANRKALMFRATTGFFTGRSRIYSRRHRTSKTGIRGRRISRRRQSQDESRCRYRERFPLSGAARSIDPALVTQHISNSGDNLGSVSQDGSTRFQTEIAKRTSGGGQSPPSPVQRVRQRARSLESPKQSSEPRWGPSRVRASSTADARGPGQFHSSPFCLA